MAMSSALVEVKAQIRDGCLPGVYTGKIATLIGDVRVGRVILCNDSSVQLETGDPQLQQSFIVKVPVDRVLHIEVDRKLDFNNQRVKHLELFKFANGRHGTVSKNHEVDDHEVEVKINWFDEEEESIISTLFLEQEFINTFPVQPQRPVEIKMVSGHCTVVYTIGGSHFDDEVSFNELIMALRRMLADHPGREDILDGHDFLNLSSTREHPLLPRVRVGNGPARWIHVKLQVKGGKNKKWNNATLILRDDDLYVHGFKNKDGVWYEILDDKHSDPMLPVEYNPRRLHWGLKYRTILNIQDQDQRSRRNQVIDTLVSMRLHKAFMVQAVERLSMSGDDPDQPVNGINMTARKALAGLIVMVCESARMNPIHDSIARGWTDGMGFTQDLVRPYLWSYRWMSEHLLTWKKNANYVNQHVPINKRLQAIYLVLNTRWPDANSSGASGSAGGSASQPGRQSGSSGSPASGQAGEASSSDPGSSAGGSATASQHEEAGGGGVGASPSRQPGMGHGQQPKKAGDAQVYGRRRVELLSVRTDRGDIVNKIIVIDGKRGHIVYKQEAHEGQPNVGMVNLLLTGPRTAISAEYGCFAIKIDIPAPDAGRSSSSGKMSSVVPSIQWEWDCCNPKHAIQVDQPPVTETISEEPACVEVTYAVMSNALEATVQVMLHLKDVKSADDVVIDGSIAARIGNFKDWSFLFSRHSNTRVSPTNDDSCFLLQLSRNLVMVPCGEVLHIQVLNLQIATSNSEEFKDLDGFTLSFTNGTLSKYHEFDGGKVLVNVTWYPEMWQPDAVFRIGDELSFVSFIKALRRDVADHPDREDILDRHRDKNISSTRDHPLLPKVRARDQVRWLHVKLEAVEGNETSWTTLAMRDDNLYVHGFMNQQGVWYGLVDNTITSGPCMLQPEYNAKLLDWGGAGYKSILGAKYDDEAMDKLAHARMGRDFAMHAVRELSCYYQRPATDVSYADAENRARMALAGLILMVCESARMDRILNYFAGGWSSGIGFTKELMTGYVMEYGNMSRRLREWKQQEYAQPQPNSELGAIYLVLNGPRPARGVDV